MTDLNLRTTILPSAYEQLTYIESDSSHQYINLNYIPTMQTGVKAHVEYTSLASDNYFIGCRDDSGNTRFWLGIAGNALRGAIGNWGSSGIPAVANKKYLFTFNLNCDKKQGLDDNIKDLTMVEEFEPERPMYLFAPNNKGIANYGSACKIYDCKIYEGSKLVMDLVPAKRKIDNIVGMYDLVTETFYTNQGTGSFIAGDVVVTVPEIQIQTDDDKEFLQSYELLEYLDSNITVHQTGTPQYINTDFVPNNNSKIELKFQHTTDNTNGDAFFGIRTSATGVSLRNAFLMWGASAGYWRAQYGSQNFVSTIPKDKNVHTWIMDKNVCTLDGNAFNTFNEETFTCAESLPLFVLKDTGVNNVYEEPTRIYYCKLWNNGTLARDFIPAKRKSDNVLGLYDKVSKTFFTNAGTGTFTGGDIAKVGDVKYIELPFAEVWTKAKEIPSIYTKKNYLESTGTQYIDTGVKGNLNTEIQSKVYKADNSFGILWGNYSDSSKAITLNVYNGKIGNQRFGNKSFSVAPDVFLEHTHTSKIKMEYTLMIRC